jgi:hypothetical protein
VQESPPPPYPPTHSPPPPHTHKQLSDAQLGLQAAKENVTLVRDGMSAKLSATEKRLQAREAECQALREKLGLSLSNVTSPAISRENTAEDCGAFGMRGGGGGGGGDLGEKRLLERAQGSILCVNVSSSRSITSDGSPPKDITQYVSGEEAEARLTALSAELEVSYWFS